MVASATFVPVVNTNPLVCAAALNPSGCPVGALFVYSVYSTYKLKHFNAIGSTIPPSPQIPLQMQWPAAAVRLQDPKAIPCAH